MTTAVERAQAPQPSKILHFSLWGAQILLALAFMGAGAMKLSQSQADILAMGEHMAWAGRVPAALIKFIGLSELLGGLGLILPAATRIKPVLTPIAAAALALVMALAAGFHLMYGEMAIGPNIGFGALAAFIAWGRFRKAPIQPR